MGEKKRNIPETESNGSCLGWKNLKKSTKYWKWNLMAASWIFVAWFNNRGYNFEEQSERDLKDNKFSFEDMSKKDKKK